MSRTGFSPIWREPTSTPSGGGGGGGGLAGIEMAVAFQAGGINYADVTHSKVSYTSVIYDPDNKYFDVGSHPTRIYLPAAGKYEVTHLIWLNFAAASVECYNAPSWVGGPNVGGNVAWKTEEQGDDSQLDIFTFSEAFIITDPGYIELDIFPNKTDFALVGPVQTTVLYFGDGTGSGLGHMAMVSNAEGSASPIVIAPNGLADIPLPDLIIDTDSYISAVDPAFPLVIPSGLDGLYDLSAGITFESTTSDPTSGFVWATLYAGAPGGTPVWGDVAEGRFPYTVWTSSNELLLHGKAPLYEGAKLELFVWNKTNASVTFNGLHLQWMSAVLLKQFTPTYS